MGRALALHFDLSLSHSLSLCMPIRLSLSANKTKEDFLIALARLGKRPAEQKANKQRTPQSVRENHHLFNGKEFKWQAGKLASCQAGKLAS